MDNLSEFIDLPREPSDSLDPMLTAMEISLGVNLTLHDARGLLRGVEISKKWLNHQHPICCYKRKGMADRFCLQTCLTDVHSRASSSPSSFEKRCWKGLVEVVSPYYRDEQLQFIIFAGPFRSLQKSEPPPHGIREEYEKLELRNEDRLRNLSEVLIVLGQSIFEHLEEHAVSPSGSTERMSLIRKFIYQHASEKTSLKDLADHLFLSPSRASHLVSDLFSQSFSEMLKEERIKRACSILKNSRKPIKHIPEMIGLESEFHFYRLFKKEVGMTPKKYRDLQQS